MSTKGIFIVLEGIDGSGKSTQMRVIEDIMKNKFPNKRYIITREPGGHENVVGEKIRNIILENKMDNHTRILLYAASRYEHAMKISEWLNKGYVVFCDRYIGSSLAYQLDEKTNLKDIMDINKYHLLPKPDFIFYFDITKETYLTRKGIREKERELDELEKDIDKKIDKLLINYNEALKVLGFYKTEVIHINANESISDIAFEINKYLNVLI